MMKIYLLVFALFIGLLFTKSASAIANPASVYCEQNGYELNIITNPDGSQYGVCTFSDGSKCEEWAYFRGECSPKKEGLLNKIKVVFKRLVANLFKH